MFNKGFHNRAKTAAAIVKNAAAIVQAPKFYGVHIEPVKTMNQKIFIDLKRGFGGFK